LISTLVHTLQAYKMPKQRLMAVPANTTTHALPGTLSAMNYLLEKKIG
jgi:hypothetical protein